MKYEDEDDSWIEFSAGFMVGREETFDEMERECLMKRHSTRGMPGLFNFSYARKSKKKAYWKMETAMEADEEDEKEEEEPAGEGNAIGNKQAL